MAKIYSKTLLRNFGAKISSARKKAELTQRDCARLMGISGPHLSNIEHGINGPPAVRTLLKFANVLGTPQDHLCAMAGSMPPDIQKLAMTSDPARFQREFSAFRRAVSEDQP